MVECFNSLEKLNISSNEFEIIVVDNNSSDEINKIIENY
ncbi:glycosyltransferase [Limnohabitans sp. Rim8]